MEYKRFSVGFVLALLSFGNASLAFADDLPPPPPPPPGAHEAPLPTNTGNSSILEAPPPPPPGVEVDPTPKRSATAPSTSTTSGSDPTNLTAPPPAPDGVETSVPPRKKVRTPKPIPRVSEDDSPKTSPTYRYDDTPKPAPSTWYGWKSLIGLIPVHAFFIAGAASETIELYIPAVIGGMLVTPVAHWTHGNKGRGWASFGVNIGAMAVGGVAGGGYGASVVLGLWNLIDIAALHHQSAPNPSVADKPNPFPSFAVVPMMGRGRTGLTLVGQF